MTADVREPLLDEVEVRSMVSEIATRVAALVPASERFVLMGIQRRGVQLAALLSDFIEQQSGRRPPSGTIDINLYRDDLQTVGPRPLVGQTHFPPEGIDGATVILVDDVLYTGRTIRSALQELGDFGRPSRILLVVLVDRGGRELPIQADVVGRRVDCPPGGRVEVRVPQVDGSLGVDMIRGGSA